MEMIIRSALAALFAPLLFSAPLKAEEPPQPNWSIAIHGGAGTITPERITPELREQYESALQDALDKGAAVLAEGGTAMDAVKAAIIPLEDNPLFNAGRGAVFTWEGDNELDASIMDGRDRSAGAVSGVTSIKNPILLADAVRTESRHVFLSGAGAEEFASEHGIETAGPDWFETEHRRESLVRMKSRELSSLDVDHKFGTVGAVALDQDGNLAAGTSTGGMTGKRWGRIGDSPVIGAGTYADNRSCAVSATGWGEYFIRVGVAQEICTRLRMQRSIDPEAIRLTLERISAMEPPEGQFKVQTEWVPLGKEISQLIADGVMDEVKELGGDGGIILVTPEGDALFSFNTTGMYRGRATSTGLNEVGIFGGEGSDTPSSTPDH